jgi:hypothetical protein
MICSEILSPVLFSPSVPAHHVALKPGDLDTGLYYGLLLEPALGFLDSSFFMIPTFEHHVKAARQLGYGESWLEMGLKKGAIIPLVREEVSSFDRMLDVLLRDKYVGVSEKQRDFANLLRSKVAQTRLWPAPEQYGFGSELAKRVSEVFLSQVAPLAKGLPSAVALEAMGVWAETREWREAWIPRAIENRKRLSGPGHGLRLMDVIQVAGRDILGDDTANILSVDGLFKVARKAFAKDKRKQALLQKLLVLLDHEWLNNFCGGMTKCGVPIGLARPRWHRVVSLLDSETVYETVDINHVGSETAASHDITVELPSISAC